jgi:Protein of unknown function (DUF2844)
LAQGSDVSMAPVRRRRTSGYTLLVIASVAWLAAGSQAEAALGRARDSVEADRIHLSARMASTTLANHTVHTLTLPNGGVVREYMRSDGTVFAVSWRGPGRPDLRQLLGDSFDTLQADQAARVGRRARHTPLSVARSDLIIHSGGHPGAFWGFGYLPHEAPAGFSGKDLN